MRLGSFPTARTFTNESAGALKEVSAPMPASRVTIIVKRLVSG